MAKPVITLKTNALTTMPMRKPSISNLSKGLGDSVITGINRRLVTILILQNNTVPTAKDTTFTTIHQPDLFTCCRNSIICAVPVVRPKTETAIISNWVRFSTDTKGVRNAATKKPITQPPMVNHIQRLAHTVCCCKIDCCESPTPAGTPKDAHKEKHPRIDEPYRIAITVEFNSKMRSAMPKLSVTPSELATTHLSQKFHPSLLSCCSAMMCFAFDQKSPSSNSGTKGTPWYHPACVNQIDAACSRVIGRTRCRLLSIVHSQSAVLKTHLCSSAKSVS